MTVSKPEPGDLVKTVVDLVDAVNAGGGSTDLSAYSGPSISLTANANSIDLITTTMNPVNLTSDGTINLRGNGGVDIEDLGGIGGVFIGSSGNSINVFNGIALDSPGGISTTASGTGAVGLFSDGPSEVIVSPTQIDVVAAAASGTINLTADGNINLLSNNSSVQIEGKNVTSLNAGGFSGIIVGSTGSDPTHGFFGSTPVAQPVVPLTTPTVQNVIDALVALGLIAQHD